VHILFIAPYVPSLIRVRPFNLIKALAKREHTISLLCLVQTEKELSDLEHLGRERYCENLDTVHLSRIRSIVNCIAYSPFAVSLQAAYCFSGKMNEKVTRALQEHQFDVVHLEHIRAAHFLRSRTDVASVFDAVDCITSLYEQFSQHKPSWLGKWTSGLEYRKLRRYEPREASRFDRVIVTSRKDKEDLQGLAPNLPVDVITNGVDTDYFRPSDGLVETPSIVFSGKMSYYANDSAAMFLCDEVMPHVKACEPGATLTIAGSSPSKRVRRHGTGHGIEVTGHVPDIRVCLRNARVAACPVSVGAGVQNKVLEAMAMGKPVVATSKACQALSVVDGEHVLIADQREEFAEALVRIIRDDDLAVRLGRNGREYVDKRHNWNEKARQLEETYSKAIASAAARARNDNRG
jgi:sugar transferase (PEP-CTERM/EpsH1 system associated)